MANGYLASKPRYEILDGLRGVAAIMVVIFHLFETYAETIGVQVLGHGYLAVDFFFVLSGYVIGYAYDDRWDKMSRWDFFKRRLVRLQPMVVFGVAFGAALFYLQDCYIFPNIMRTPWWKLLLVMVLSAMIIPMPSGLDIRGWGEMTPLNGPVWSLQWEYLANILYALFFRKMPKKFLAVFVALFACLTVILCFNIDVTGFFADRGDLSYTVIGGWALNGEMLQVGFSRLMYPFFCGLLLSRMGAKIHVNHGFGVCSILIIILLGMPRFSAIPAIWNGAYEALCILVLFPLIVVIGAGSSVKKTSAKVNQFLGEISYPIYLVHYPLIYVQMAWAAQHQNAPVSQHLMILVFFFLLSIGFAYTVYKTYDIPVRKWLRGKVFPSKTEVKS